jgi:site-specific DNA recombinase
MLNDNVMIIPARKRMNGTEIKKEKPKTRVAAYCRVSTDSSEQELSYEAQKEFYLNFINGRDEWEMAGVFADQGISGTSTKNRTEFNKMIDDCNAGKIDMIITKSISRFSRNTVDCLQHIRELKGKGIPVFFEKENINTMDAKGEIMITIMASLAQQESQSLSQNVRMGIKYRYERGEVQVNHKRFLGYTKDEDKKLVVVPKEAKIIRRIYREYLEGSSLSQISKGLEKDGVLTGAGNKKWRDSTVKKILLNEKYIGDALLQKTFTVDFLTKKRVVNDGIAQQYYVKGCHEAIIPKEIYLQVQEEMARRGNLSTGKKKRIYSGKYVLSNMIYCAECGDIFKRVHWHHGGKKKVVWRCASKLEGTDVVCNSKTISESDIKSAVVKGINKLLVGKDDFIDILKNNIRTVLSEENDETFEEIDGKLKDLQVELLKLAGENRGYDKVTNEILNLNGLKEKAMISNAERDGQRKRIDDVVEFMEGCSGVQFMSLMIFWLGG